MQAPLSLPGLIEQYYARRSHFAEGDTGRREICRSFIDPVLGYLGWEPVESGGCRTRKIGFTREVPVRISGRVTCIDYVLCTGSGGVLAIMVGNHSAAGLFSAKTVLDLRRYAWSAGLRLAIFTNFGESAVYDATIPVQYGDDEATARIATVTADQFVERWDRIAGLISRECVLRGSRDISLQEKGDEEKECGVGQVLSADLEEWRLHLAKRIALRNHGLSAESINEVVQHIITRILFLRIAEDRGIGQYGQLCRVTEGGFAYGRLCGLFRHAEDEYGKGLFCSGEGTHTNESADTLTLTLLIDDEPVKNIITQLSPPKSPYEFSVIPAQILAEAFSLFLGKVIRLTPGNHALVEERPEIRKAGGPSGTPREIAEYIVRKTLDERVTGKTPRDLAGLHVLDPACGSGLFLVNAFEYLLDWHLSWYTDNLVPAIERGDSSPGEIGGFLHGPEKEGEPGRVLPVTRSRGSEGNSIREETIWELTADERKRILLAMIFGVDIDMRAVQTTRLLLLVKFIESFDNNGGLPLPDLSGTIRCGNSLVGSDIVEDPDASLIDPRSRERLRVFDWEDAFPGIMASGGFDTVVGHLPRFRRETLRGEKEYLEKRYRTYSGTAELYHCFIEKGISLLRPGGQFSAILPDAWLRADHGTMLRVFLGGLGIREIIDFGNQGAWKAGVLQSCIIRAIKEAPGPYLSVVQGEIPETGTFKETLETLRYTVPRSRLGRRSWILSDTRVQDLVRKVQEAGTPLGEYVMGALNRGIRIGPRSALIIDGETKKRLVLEDPESAGFIRPFLSPGELKRYLCPGTSGSHIIIVPHGTDLKKYPALFRHLLHYKNMPVQKDRNENEEERELKTSAASPWYALPDMEAAAGLFEEPKIVFPGIAMERRFTLDTAGTYFPETCRIIRSSSLYLLGILNSRLIWFIIRQTIPPFHGKYRRLYGPLFENIPVWVPDFDDPGEVARHDSLEGLVQQMLSFQTRYAETDDPREKKICRRHITELDDRIDAVVYELYRITPDEILIAERDMAGKEPSC